MSYRIQQDQAARLRARLLGGCTGAALCGAMLVGASQPAAASLLPNGALTPDPAAADRLVVTALDDAVSTVVQIAQLPADDGSDDDADDADDDELLIDDLDDDDSESDSDSDVDGDDDDDDDEDDRDDDRDNDRDSDDDDDGDDDSDD